MIPDDCSGARIKPAHKSAINAKGTMTVVQSILFFKDSDVCLLINTFFHQQRGKVVQKLNIILIIEHYSTLEVEMQAKKTSRILRICIPDVRVLSKYHIETDQKNQPCHIAHCEEHHIESGFCTFRLHIKLQRDQACHGCDRRSESSNVGAC